MSQDLWSPSTQRRSFTSDLEAKARGVVAREQDAGDRPIEQVVSRELALILDQINQTKDVHARQLRSLLRVECYVDTELIHMEQRTPRYSPYRFPEREKLQRRLMAIEAERRKLAADHQVRLTQLHDRLLATLHRHMHLAPSY